jgi:hypothetical protein
MMQPHCYSYEFEISFDDGANIRCQCAWILAMPSTLIRPAHVEDAKSVRRRRGVKDGGPLMVRGKHWVSNLSGAAVAKPYGSIWEECLTCAHEKANEISDLNTSSGPTNNVTN